MAEITSTPGGPEKPLDPRRHALQLLGVATTLLNERGRLPHGLWIQLGDALALALDELPPERWQARVAV